MDFDKRFKDLPQEERYKMILMISSAITELNQVNYPRIKSMLSQSDGRMGLLKRIVKEKMGNKKLTYSQIIDQIENISD